MKKTLIRFLIFSSCIIGCNKQEKYATENSKLFNNKELNISSEIKTIFIVSEKGCHGCSKYLYNYILTKTSEKSSYFIVNATGMGLDITKSKNIKTKNFKIYRTSDEFFNNTQIILVNNKTIDTIIKINAPEILNQIAFIENYKK